MAEAQFGAGQGLSSFMTRPDNLSTEDQARLDAILASSPN
jgi:hypothetical protein